MQALLPASLRNLLADLERLPGVGPKSAQRIVFTLLERRAEEREAFARHLLELSAAKACRTCGMLADRDRCAICTDATRDGQTICVVETPLDVVALERTDEYRGTYHVLGGVISPLEGIGPEALRVTSLLTRVTAEKPLEIIIALNPSTEGDVTTLYLREKLPAAGVRVTRLAQGLPTGAALEFADDLTISRALAGRQEVRPAVPVRQAGR